MIMNNISPSIKQKIGRNLHLKKNHPLEIIKRKIYNYFGEDFKNFDEFSPYVNIEENFDKLLIPKNHPARSMSDTYYLDENTVLRTHTSAHQNELLRKGEIKFLVTGDVYRKDDIDSSHYPIFHQMEGVCVMQDGQNPEEELKKILTGLVETLFPGCEYRMNSDYFPFTEPSFEVEVMFNGRWMEILGCGVVHSQIMENCGLSDKKAYAFGLGLERLAMILFGINDIRYFHSNDSRFIDQFKSGKIITFKPYSKYPSTERDISFWINDEFNHNNFCEIIREIGGDLIENVSVVDEFTNKKTNRTSKCYRITYRSNDRSLTNDEINDLQVEIRDSVKDAFSLELR